MTCYEETSLILTGIYDFLTLSLLIMVIYESIIKPRLPNITFYRQDLPDDNDDTEAQSEKRQPARGQLADFVLENRGHEIKNVKITSEPDYIGWHNYGGFKPRKTSEIFQKMIPFLGRNERLQFFWCDLEKNIDIVKKPFIIVIEFDNPILSFLPRRKRVFAFDLSVFDEVAWGLTGNLDIHNVAQEIARIRKELKR